MIGMKQIKENVVDQILFYIQNLHQPIEPDTKSKSKLGIQKAVCMQRFYAYGDLWSPWNRQNGNCKDY